MITKNDAIRIGTVACKVAAQFSTEKNDSFRHLGRGTIITVLDDIYYGVLTLQVRQQFKSKDEFYTLCGWPE